MTDEDIWTALQSIYQRLPSLTFGYAEWFPAYIFPWLNAISIPCLAAMKTTGATAATLTNVFGGSLNNEGLGLFSLSFDWQYVRTGCLAPSEQQVRKADENVNMTTDHFLPDQSSSEPAVTPGCRLHCVLRSHAGHLLHRCLGLAVAALHVHVAQASQRNDLPVRSRLPRRCSGPCRA